MVGPAYHDPPWASLICTFHTLGDVPSTSTLYCITSETLSRLFFSVSVSSEMDMCRTDFQGLLCVLSTVVWLLSIVKYWYCCRLVNHCLIQPGTKCDWAPSSTFLGASYLGLTRQATHLLPRPSRQAERQTPLDPVGSVEVRQKRDLPRLVLTVMPTKFTL